MSNYKLIACEETLTNFVENFLPDLTRDETYYCTLFARRKYWPVIKADKGQLKRFVSPKHRLIKKIKQLEIEEGGYEFDGIPIPQEALCLYITPNPRSNIKATQIALRKCADLIANGNSGYNLHQEMMSCVQQAKSRTCFIDFDFDCDVCPDVRNMLNPESYSIVKTRGGYHILVKPDLVDAKFKKSFHQKISKMPGCDVRGDCLLPIPGTYQGGHIVRLM